jgi:hypothetical protein
MTNDNYGTDIQLSYNVAFRLFDAADAKKTHETSGILPDTGNMCRLEESIATLSANPGFGGRKPIKDGSRLQGMFEDRLKPLKEVQNYFLEQTSLQGGKTQE